MEENMNQAILMSQSPMNQAIPMNQSPTLGELFGAMAKAQGMMSGAKKGAENPFFKSKYADLHQVWEAVREPLSKNGLSVIQTTGEHNGQIFVYTTIGHSSGEWMRSETPVKLMKQDPQAMGSAITYARRYALAAICGIAQMDDDAESAMSRDQVNPDPINQLKVKNAVGFFKKQIDADVIEETHQSVKNTFRSLTNDEKLAVADQLGDKSPGSNKLYKNLLKEYVSYKPEEGL